jgi:hypothetical protein
MRSLIAFLGTLLTLVTPLAAAAQSSTGSPRVSVGAEAGFVLATLSSYQSPNTDEAFDTGFRNGFIVGGLVDVRLRNGWSLRPGVYFVEKGAVIRFADGGGVDSATVNLHYVEFAALLHVTAARPTIRPFLNAGATFAGKTGAEVDASASGGPSNIDVGSQVRAADVGFAVGGGVEDRRWSVEARFVQGVIDVGNTQQVDDVVRTRTLSFIAGIRF